MAAPWITSLDVAGGNVAHLDALPDPHPDLTRRLTEDFDSFGWGGYPQNWQMFGAAGYGTAFGPFGFRPAYGTTADRKGGRDLPLYWNEIDLRGFRVLSRYLYETNGFAIGFLDRLTDYHVRAGYGWQACLKGKRKTPYSTNTAATDDAVTRAQGILDQWRDANCWAIDSREAFRRWRRDGEVFVRWFYGGWEGLPQFRFLDPAQIGSPTGDVDSEQSFGILTEKGDPRCRIGYHVWSVEEPTEGEWVGAERIQHLKANVDSDVKRGLPDFFPLHEHLDGVRRLLSATLTTAVRQAKVAWIEKFATATPAQVQAHVPFQVTTPGSGVATSGYPGQVGPWAPGAYQYPGYPGSSANLFPPDGTVVRTEGTRQFEPGPNAANVPNFLAVEQAVLRAAGARWGMPEYFSGDASNNNFASAMVAGSPFAVAVEGKQTEWGVFERSVALKVLELARDAGLLTHEEFARLDVEVTPPAVVTPDPDKDTSRRAQMFDRGVLSAQEWILEDGRDPQHTAENLAAWTAKPEAGAGGKGTPPAGGGGSGGGAGAGGGEIDQLTAALAKGKESRAVHVNENAPGPPPRPGLVWNDDTKRWRNPDTGEEHEHPKQGGASDVQATHKELAAKMPELTGEQFEAVGDYTSGAYEEINASLREGRQAKKAAGAIPHIAAAIDAAPVLDEPITVYRGVRMTGEQGKDFLAKCNAAAESGGFVQDPAFASTTIDPQVAATWATGGKGAESPVVMEISAKKGLYIGESAGGTKEKEFILQKGTKLRVVAVEKRGTYTAVKLEQVL